MAMSFLLVDKQQVNAVKSLVQGAEPADAVRLLRLQQPPWVREVARALIVQHNVWSTSASLGDMQKASYAARGAHLLIPDDASFERLYEASLAKIVRATAQVAIPRAVQAALPAEPVRGPVVAAINVAVETSWAAGPNSFTALPEPRVLLLTYKPGTGWSDGATAAGVGVYSPDDFTHAWECAPQLKELEDGDTRILIGARYHQLPPAVSPGGLKGRRTLFTYLFLEVRADGTPPFRTLRANSGDTG